MKEKNCEGNLNEFLLLILSPPFVLLHIQSWVYSPTFPADSMNASIFFYRTYIDNRPPFPRFRKILDVLKGVRVTCQKKPDPTAHAGVKSQELRRHARAKSMEKESGRVQASQAERVLLFQRHLKDGKITTRN